MKRKKRKTRREARRERGAPSEIDYKAVAHAATMFGIGSPTGRLEPPPVDYMDNIAPRGYQPPITPADGIVASIRSLRKGAAVPAPEPEIEPNRRALLVASTARIAHEWFEYEIEKTSFREHEVFIVTPDTVESLRGCHGFSFSFSNIFYADSEAEKWGRVFEEIYSLR